MSTSRNTTVNPDEVDKFNRLAQDWWTVTGKFRPLHTINPLRRKYVSERVDLATSSVIDVGCGAGIFTEGLMPRATKIVGIDPAADVIAAAKVHAEKVGTANRVEYIHATAEQYLENNDSKFDCVCAFEMLEHVSDVQQTIKSLAKLCKPGGDLFLSTINRHPLAYFKLVAAGEYLLNVLPRGTHLYDQFIKPSELAQFCRNAGLYVSDVQGYSYNPFFHTASMTDAVDSNYLLHAINVE